MGLERAVLQEGCSLQRLQNTLRVPGESSGAQPSLPRPHSSSEEGGVVVIARPRLTPETPSGKVGREEEGPKLLLLILCWSMGKLGALGCCVGHCPVTFQRPGVADSG